MPKYVCLGYRATLTLTGKDSAAFLQGMVSNDVSTIAPDRAITAALLTPQGKFLYDLFMATRDGKILLDADAAHADELLVLLAHYRLRADAWIDKQPDYEIIACFGDKAPEIFDLKAQAGQASPMGKHSLAMVDPRLANLGVRIFLHDEDRALLDRPDLHEATEHDYHHFRLSLGIPDGSLDVRRNSDLLLEGNADALNGVSWSKGCYMGQEVTARTHYRGAIKKRLIPVRIEGGRPDFGAPVFHEGKEIGEMRGAQDEVGLALLDLSATKEAIASSTPFTCGNTRLAPFVPAWIRGILIES